MSEYSPPDSLSVILDFKEELIHQDSHNLILDFGSEKGLNLARIKLRARFRFSAICSNELPIDNRGNARIKIKTNLKIRSTSSLDFDHLVGVSLGLSFNYAVTNPYILKTEIPWFKSILRVSNKALFFDKGLSTSSGSYFSFGKALTLSESIYSYFEQGLGVAGDAKIVWQESKKLPQTNILMFENGESVVIKRAFQYQEMLRLRRTVSMSHQVADQFERVFSFKWDKGLEIITQDKIRWEITEQIHYRKHAIEPHPTPEAPKYQGNGNLDFNCLCINIDSHNVVLNFGEDDCLPARVDKKWWYILNNISVTRLDNGEPITVIDGTYETGRDRWCWIYSLTIAPKQLHKLQPIGNTPVILKIMVNGFEHHMLVEGEPEESHKFAETLHRLNGRSVTALDSENYASKRSFLQENERRAGQLCQAELDRVFSDTILDWQLLEDTGWIVPTQSLTYANLAPIDAIKMVVDAGGGFIYSQKNSKALSILPKYKKSFWNPMQFEDYDLILNSGMMLQHDVKKNETSFDYDSIMMINSLSGNTARVGIVDTPRSTPLETTSNPLFTTVSMGGYAKTALSSANVKERHTFNQMIVSQDIGEMLPGKTISFDAEWWGVIDTVKGSFNHEKVWESIEVERISRE